MYKIPACWFVILTERERLLNYNTSSCTCICLSDGEGQKRKEEKKMMTIRLDGSIIHNEHHLTQRSLNENKAGTGVIPRSYIPFVVAVVFHYLPFLLCYLFYYYITTIKLHYYVLFDDTFYSWHDP